MPRQRFPYTLFEVSPGPSFPQGRRAARAILPVMLAKGAARVSCYAMIDSGADHCTFPISLLSQLAVDSATLPHEAASGVGGKAVSHFCEVTLAFPGLFQHGVYAAFTPQLDTWSIGLLGQSGFFDRLKVSFDLRDGTFEIEA